ncbi:hypothetical protein [Hymenobacter elongatus]|uniref:DUF922 domain-containing protein n=1 Tax=Hymenobacter elongatus TaxID=877208 RepID=A0A4Z0PFX2_9BACT|nr:hypothetical protein [Hymenobacter elongatus]TGE14029.1 hypothetical protein E5J99_17750 [Hymenobacter elongatus]
MRILSAGILLLLHIGYSAAAQGTTPLPSALVLKPATQRFTSAEFHVARVVDERATRTAVAWLLPSAAKTGVAPTVRPVDFQGGGRAAIESFIRQMLPCATSRRPLTIRLQEYQVIETAVAGSVGQIEGRVVVKMALDWQRQGQTIFLTTYQGAARYRRPAGPTSVAVVEPVLRQALAEALRYLHSWVETQAPGNVKLATDLRLRFTDYRDQTESDTLFYDPARPLVWADFTALPHTGPYAAAVFPSFAYAGQPRVEKGVLVLQLSLKVFVVRSSSWVSAQARGAYDLNHEQRHFDLVKLVAERFKRRLTPERVTLQDYNSILQYEYLLAFQEMNRLQEQYDAQTHGGQNEAVQESWNQRITAELRQYGVTSAGQATPAAPESGN